MFGGGWWSLPDDYQVKLAPGFDEPDTYVDWEKIRTPSMRYYRPSRESRIASDLRRYNNYALGEAARRGQISRDEWLGAKAARAYDAARRRYERYNYPVPTYQPVYDRPSWVVDLWKDHYRKILERQARERAMERPYQSNWEDYLGERPGPFPSYIPRESITYYLLRRLAERGER